MEDHDVSPRTGGGPGVRLVPDLFQGLLHHLRDGVASVDREGFFVACNPAFLDLLGGYAMEEVRRLRWQDLTPPEWRAPEQAILEEQVDRRGFSDLYEKEYVRRDGTRVPVEVRTYANRDDEGRLEGYWAIVRDVSDRRDTRSRLALFQESLDNATDAIGMATPEGRHFYQNRAFTDLFGECGDDPKTALFVDRSQAEEVFRTIKAGGRWEGEVRMHAKDGGIRDILLRAHANLDLAGRVTALVGIHTDITSRKAIERELREREHQLRTVIENVDLVFFALGPDGVFQFSEGRGLGALGLRPGEVVGRSAFEVYSEFPEIVQSLHRALAGERFQVEVSVGPLWFDVAYTPVRGPDGSIQATIGVAMDITSRRKAEEDRERLTEQLVQARKLEAIGQLAGGVAHDFNNMLAVILGVAEVALNRLGPEDPIREDLHRIREAAERSADLTRQLLAFARRQNVAPRVVDLNEVLSGRMAMIRRLIGENITLDWVPGKDVGRVRIDPSQMDQVLVNLCANARDAIEGAGRITIETARVVFDEPYCADHPEHSPGTYAALVVSDNGRGMDEATRRRLFEPFFTTKAQGSGVGLGLATVYGIVRQNDGFIHVYSEPGMGSTFRVYLPCWEEQATPVEASGPREGAPVRDGQTILLVEDDDLVRAVVSRMLDHLGYRVLAVGDPVQAIETARNHPGELHVLLTDVVMPGMNGRQLAREVARIRPGIRRIFMSGYTANGVAHRGILDPGVELLQKPFLLRDLSQRIQAVLAAPPPLEEDP
ncbi:MAG TPA: PAS domain S-box protein [Myxococcota bacterium]|nr:PAS domain S-box protein [Myxococcota bacterium]HQK52150.1 PAS domain S-box protein [Myxococcota bacterium]